MQGTVYPFLRYRQPLQQRRPAPLSPCSGLFLYGTSDLPLYTLCTAAGGRSTPLPASSHHFSLRFQGRVASLKHAWILLHNPAPFLETNPLVRPHGGTNAITTTSTIIPPFAFLLGERGGEGKILPPPQIERSLTTSSHPLFPF